MSFFEQILKALLPMRNAFFWPIWITITAAAAIGLAAAVGQAPRGQKKRPINLILTWRQVGTPGAVAALTLLAVFLASYIAMTLAREDFAYSDDAQFIDVTLRGHDIALQISRGGTGASFGLPFSNLT